MNTGNESVGDNPAFPIADISKTQCPGVTYRQWLIGQILSGVDAVALRNSPPDPTAEAAILLADSVIARLDKENRYHR